MSQIIFYHNPMSRGRIAHWMLEELGQPYTVELLDFEKREHKSPEYLALNPMGKIPTIVHHDTVVTEAAAICAYLADAFPSAKLAPALDDPARGTYFRWLFFAAACGEPAIGDRMLQRPAASASALGYGSYEDTLHALETAVGQAEYILGRRFSAADVYVSSLIGWGLMTKAIEPRPTLHAYVERTHQRPAVKRMLAQNEEFAQQLKG
jgi:glutathione S-transferase